MLHKEKEYGILVLSKTEKKYEDQVKNFSTLLTRFLPYEVEEIITALNELLAHKVLRLEGDKLIQKRMVKDGVLSDKRSKAGKKGGDRTRDNARFAQAKPEAKPEDPLYPEISDSEELDPVIEEKKSILITNIATKFNYMSHENKKQQSMITAFVHSLPFHGKLDFFITEFESYKKLKEIDNDQYIHTIERFIGTQSLQYKDGKWDDNWTKKLTDKQNNNGNTNKPRTEGTRSNTNPTPKRSFRKQL
jgi:hypothetical protein